MDSGSCRPRLPPPTVRAWEWSLLSLSLDFHIWEMATQSYSPRVVVRIKWANVCWKASATHYDSGRKRVFVISVFILSGWFLMLRFGFWVSYSRLTAPGQGPPPGQTGPGRTGLCSLSLKCWLLHLHSGTRLWATGFLYIISSTPPEVSVIATATSEMRKLRKGSTNSPSHMAQK